MDAADIERLVSELELGVDRLRSLYEQYFMGLEKIEPMVPRKDVDRRIHALRKEQIRNTAQRFRFQMILQRYNTYQTHWQRICREIENGTYKRHVQRAQKKFAAEGAASSPAPVATLDAAHPPPRQLTQAMEAELAELDRDFAPMEPLDEADLLGEPPTVAVPKRPAPVVTAGAPPPLPARPGPPRLPTPQGAPPPAAPKPAPPALARPATGPAIRPAPPPILARPPTAPAMSPQKAPVAFRPQVPPPAPTPPVRAPAPTAPAAPPPAAAPAPLARPATRPAFAPTAAAPAPPAAVVRTDMPDDRVRQIYSEYVDAKRKHNESTAAITYEGVAKTLRESSAKLREKHGKAVDFEVAMKDGKTVLKPVLK